MNRRLATRTIAALLGTPFLGAFATQARAQSDKPLTLVVPYAAGGTSDMLGRLLARQMAEPLGRTVVVENRPGAGSTIGAAHVARSAPDGNTLLIATSSTLAINPLLYPKLPYDPLKDFAPIAMIASVPLALVVSPSIAVRHVNDLVSLSKARPGGLSYASAGNGSPQHLAAEMFKAATDAELRHVPYGGSAAALTDVLSGQVDMMFVDLAPALPHLRAKRLRALGVSSLTRQPTLPDVPALAESGVVELRRFEAVAWQSLIAPAGTPKPLVDRLNRLVVEMLDQPPVREGLQRDGIEPRSSSPDDLATVIRTDTERWARIIKAAGISIA
jgi:tripartite-type tricarboxylate transporter receptor subunit TctC